MMSFGRNTGTSTPQTKKPLLASLLLLTVLTTLLHTVSSSNSHAPNPTLHTWKATSLLRQALDLYHADLT